ncbi:MAG TPA: YihY/virulence factor BrkB family protein [Gaiellaceae bacterium]|jgi:membrane protein|nr:YihY/virulence factor BrkB family protein [Gaiellaceae bacterium]
MSEPGAVEPQGRLTRLARRSLASAGGLAPTFARAFPRALEDLFRDRCPQYAASIAFRVLFSLFPLTILLVSIFGLVLQDDDLRQRVTDELIDVLPVSPEGQSNVRRSIEGIASPRSAIGLLSLIALLWGATGMMASLRLGLEAALKVERGRPPAHAKLVDFLLVAVTGVLVVVVVGLSAAGAFLSGLVDRAFEAAGIAADPSNLLVRDGGQLVVLVVTSLLLYRFVPAGRLRQRDALAGAVVTAVGIWGATKVLAAVFGDFSRYNLIYGSLAGVMTFLFFVYVVALILLFGAELAYAWSQPPGPPGPPLDKRIAGFLRGLFVHDGRDEPARPR